MKKTIKNPLLLFLLLNCLLSSIPVFGNEDKINACFITINSSDEKEVFKKRLSSGKNAGKFAFHELVPSSGDGYEWFGEACKKGIRCDILVVSGHFGGSFFGENTNVNLPLDTIETRSCKNDCSGIMSAPKEVFLLGCNTLAGKEEDHRSASEYLEVLLADEIPMEEASRMVEMRYGAVGTSFGDSMKRAFKNVPHIYGFHSVGPAGNTIRRYLEKYHNDVPDYEQHLTKIELERGLALMDDFTKWNQKNDAIADALKLTHFAQTSGVLIPCHGLSGMSEEDPNFRVLNNICKLRTGELSEEDGLEHVRELLLGQDFALYLPVIADYLDGKDPKLFKALLENEPGIKENILALLEKSKTGFGKLETASVAMKMGIIKPEEFSKIEKESVLSYLKPPVSTGSKDAVCSYDYGDHEGRKIGIDFDDISEEVYSDVNAISALSCLKPNDDKITDKMVAVAQMNRGKSLGDASLVYLNEVNPTESSEKMLKELLEGNSYKDRALAALVSASSGVNLDLAKEKYLELLETDRQFKALGYTLSPHDINYYFFKGLDFADYSELKGFYLKVKSKGAPDLEYLWALSPGLVKLDVDQVVEYLEDEDFQDDKDRVRAMISAYEDTDRKTPLELFPFYIELIKSEDGYEFLLDRFPQETEEDQKRLLTQLGKASLGKDQMYRMLHYLPIRNRIGPATARFIVDQYSSGSISEDGVSSFLWQVDSLSEAEKEVLKPLMELEETSFHYLLGPLME